MILLKAQDSLTVQAVVKEKDIVPSSFTCFTTGLILPSKPKEQTPEEKQPLKEESR